MHVLRSSGGEAQRSSLETLRRPPPPTLCAFSSTVPFPFPIPIPQLQSLMVRSARKTVPRQWPTAPHTARYASSTERQHVW